MAVGTVTFDAVGAGGSNTTGSNSIATSWSHTAVGGTDCAVIVGVLWAPGTGGVATFTRTVTYGGTAMSSLGSITPNNGTGAVLEFFGLMNPASGAQTVSVTVAKAATSFTLLNANSVSYTGAGGFGILPSVLTAFGTETGTAMSHAVPSGDQARVVAGFVQTSGAVPGAYSQTSRFSGNNASFGYVVGDAAGAESVTTTATRASGVDYGKIGLTIYPSGAVIPNALGAGGITGAASGDATPATMSWSHTASGSDRAVIVAIDAVTDTTGAVATHTRSVTYGGVAMTSLGSQLTNNATSGQDGLSAEWVELWGLLNPATGAQTVSVSYAHAGATYGLGGNSISYTGVSSFGTPTAGFGTETGTALSQTASSAAGEVIVAAFLQWGSTGSITAYNKFSRHTVAGNSWVAPFVVGDAPGASSVTITATRPTSGNDYAEILVPLAVVVGAVNRTAAITGNGSLTATTSAKYARTAALTGAGTLAAIARAKFASTAALTGAGALTATATAKFSRTAALTGTGVLAASAAATKFTLPALLAGGGTLTATRFAKFARTVGLAGAGTLSAAAAAAQFTLGAFLTGAGALSATASAKYARPAALSGSGTLSAAVVAKHQRDATLTGTGTLAATADGTGTPERAAPLTGHGALAAATYAKLSVTAALSGQGALTAAAYAKLFRNAALAGTGTLSATARAKFSITATLAGVGTLTATGNLAGAPERAAILTGTGTLAATAHAAPSAPTVRRFIVTRTGRIVMLGARPIVQGLTV